MRAIKIFNFRALGDAEVGIQPANLGELIRHPFVWSDSIFVAALDHERARRNQRGHLGVVKRMAEIELKHFVFTGEQITVAGIDGDILFYPFIKIRRAD